MPNPNWNLTHSTESGLPSERNGGAEIGNAVTRQKAESPLAGLPLRDAEVLGLHVQELQLEVRGRAAPVLIFINSGENHENSTIFMKSNKESTNF